MGKISSRYWVIAGGLLVLFAIASLGSWGWGAAAASCMILGWELNTVRRRHGTELRSGQIDRVRNQALENLLSGVSLEQILEGVVIDVEAVQPNMLCSILRLKQGCLVEGVAPSLPEFYNQAIDGLAIGEGVGSCGAAAWSGQRVIATDVRAHPNWRPFLEVTERAGLQACWSEPILSSSGQVLGTFAMYYREPRSPEPWELELISAVASIAGLAIERKEVELALEHSEERVRLLMDSTAEAIYGLDRDGTCTFCNRACANMLGYAGPEELLGKQMHELIHHTRADGKPYPVEECRIYRAFRSEERVHVEDELLWRKDGSSFPVEYWSHPLLRNGNLEGAVVTFVDISARRQAEQERLELKAQVLHGQKLESLGVLAGGIAHDFNNLLTVVIGHADLARGKLPVTSPCIENLDEVVKTSERAADLCRQLLAYSGHGRFVIEPLDLNAEILAMEKMLAVTIAENCTLSAELEQDLPQIEADATQIRQVLLNLITNASDALAESGGTILVRSGTASLDPEAGHTISGQEGIPGPAVFLEVSDDGCGMDAATRERLFEPFFSSKGPGHGLGLSAVQGIVKGHGGSMSVQSTQGAGTRIRVLFPALESTTAPQSTRKTHDLLENPLSGGLILVVDDNESIRTVARTMLESMGYAVVTASDGLCALSEFSPSTDQVAAVLLDLTMPKMGGEQTFHALRRLRKDLPIVLCSGYNQETVEPSLIREPHVRFLQKPFHKEALGRVLSEVMGRAASNTAR